MNPREFLLSVRERWQSLPRSRRVLLAALATAVAAVAVYLIVLAVRPPYAPLFTGLEPKQAGKIAEELRNMKIPYRLSDQGRTISVPASQVYEARIKLASKGVLADAGPGFELFDQQKFGLTEFEQRVNYQRALQEELRRTITSLKEVEQARVHLVLPKESIFLEKQLEPSAAIALKLRDQLKPEQVKGIVDLVVGSVPGMKPENVHIIDMEGNVLSDQVIQADERAKLARVSLDQYQVRRNFEKELETRIQQMLTRVLGPNRAVAMVTAELDFDQRQTTTTTVQPGQVLSQQTVTETGQGTGVGGAPGTEANLPGQNIPALIGGNTQYQKQQTTTNYQLGSQQQVLVSAPGNLRRLSVAVVLNGNFSAAQLQQVQDLVAAAVGLQPARGDQINVSAMPFETGYLEELRREMEQPAPTLLASLQKYWPLLAGAGGLLLVLLVLLLLLLRRRRRARRPVEEEVPLVPPVPAPPEPVPTVAAPPPPTRVQKLKEMAREKPSDIAEVLKLWLRE
ncbi:flagellar basal-body MS-ring/collar protein FliF [Desulfovirgula thermocuniculi]|uniref:flagellar basal-body MS-ring/collar protein FliF n=1 Tax=Desulfovirgula thermocuniculi TaxID=348842 RepID=UPI0003F591A7|nr:flagellar basal-body MS-ring/collar protein FliF [Desulfovirgula thermocuniculi]